MFVTHGAGLASPSRARYVWRLPAPLRPLCPGTSVTTDGTDEERHRRHGGLLPKIGMPAFHELGIDPTGASTRDGRRCLEASGSALGSAKKLSSGHLPRRQPLIFPPPGTGYFAYSVPGILFFCVFHLFLSKKWKRDEKNKSSCLNSKYKRRAPLLHTEAEGVRFSMSCRKFSTTQNSFF